MTNSARTPTVDPQTLRKDKVVTIYYDGDSKTYGWSALGGTLTCNDGATTSGCTIDSYGHNVAGANFVQAQITEPGRVQSVMDAAFGSGAVTVENHGIGGATVLDSINGSADPISQAPEYDCSAVTNESSTCGSLMGRLKASHAQIVVGQFLTNDQYRMTPQQYGQYVATWMATVQQNLNADGQHMTAIWEESSPICRLDAPDAGPYLKSGRAAAAAANPPVLVIDNHDYTYANYNWIPGLLDCVHPDSDLYKFLGDRAGTAMGRTVQILLGR
ncbi:hypothetical protein B0G76_1368 [Paraburkholderia sp. BL23I1N1]|uniref:hypothetical protein n=1 Tax=Paraburkholderia sp. BL23I1N1 TaxID=1938802 RepID=UPI000E76EA60|nr:hypothetical protein [Paraburkholderia sp. BL23I1N1]RKE35306.1 hypothetical protein B0G76_1368 [Paraburkholderia sp. BL23I1N1]